MFGDDSKTTQTSAGNIIERYTRGMRAFRGDFSLFVETFINGSRYWKFLGENIETVQIQSGFQSLYSEESTLSPQTVSNEQLPQIVPLSEPEPESRVRSVVFDTGSIAEMEKRLFVPLSDDIVKASIAEPIRVILLNICSHEGVRC